MCLCHLNYRVRPCLIHTCHAMLRPCRSSQGHGTAWPSRDGRVWFTLAMPCPCHALTMPFFSRAQHCTAVSRRPCSAVSLRRMAWSEYGMASMNQTRPHCVNQIGKTHSKPLAARHGRGTAWARIAMCESALNVPSYYTSQHFLISFYLTTLSLARSIRCQLMLLVSIIKWQDVEAFPASALGACEKHWKSCQYMYYAVLGFNQVQVPRLRQ